MSLPMIPTLAVTLIAFRLWVLIGRDVITQPIRDKFNPDGWVMKWATCPWCAGTWCAFGVALGGSVLGLVDYPWVVGACAAALVGLLGDRM